VSRGGKYGPMGIESSPARVRRRRERAAAQTRRWERRSGPVTTRTATPDEIAARRATGPDAGGEA
jgi:hypothetical protein